MEIVDNKKTIISVALSDENQIKKLLDILKYEEDYYIIFKKEIIWEYPILTGNIYVNPERKQELINKIKKHIKDKEK